MRRILSIGAMAWAFAFLAAVILGACSTPKATGGSGGAWCDVSQPMRLSEATIAAMTRPELEAAVAHNTHGERECGWRPNR